jgi:uncharacterized phage-associated protein
MQVFNYKKATQAIFFFLQKAQIELHKVSLLKLIWLADRLHLRNYARTIFDDVYFGMPRGPVASACKDLLENSDFLSADAIAYSQQFIEKSQEKPFLKAKNTKANFKVFSQTDLECLNTVFEHFGTMSEQELSDFSHQYPEWKHFEHNLRNSFRFEMNYQHFFENPENNHPLFEQSEEKLESAKEWFLENQMLANLIC